jgi:hypothetical protein
VNLCEELDRRVLSDITGLPLQPGTFDGAICTWDAKDGSGTLVMSLGTAPPTSAFIERVHALDIGEAVTVGGAEAATAVTITSGSGTSRTTRVALAARVHHDRLTVILTGRNANLDTAVRIAELVTDP